MHQGEIVKALAALSTTFHHVSGGAVQLREGKKGVWLNQMVTALGRTISTPLARPVTSSKTEMLLLFPAPEWLLLRAFRLFCAALRTAETLDTKSKLNLQ